MSFISVDIIVLVLQPFLKFRILCPGRERVFTIRTGVCSQPGRMFWSTQRIANGVLLWSSFLLRHSSDVILGSICDWFMTPVRVENMSGLWTHHPTYCPSCEHAIVIFGGHPTRPKCDSGTRYFTDFMPIWLYYITKPITSWSRHIHGHGTIYPDAEN